MTFGYDASDYNTSVVQGTKRTEYVKTATGDVLRKKEFDSGNLTSSHRYVAGGAVLQNCSLTDDSNCTTADRYVSLPGNVSLTLSPTSPDTDKQTVYSLHNYHGDTALTLTGEGKTTATTNTLLAYGPFGEQLLPGASGTTTATALNASDDTMGWAASPTRKQDDRYTTTFIQMGARVYIPSLGRFLQTDPVDGGTLNAYVYVADPINASDYTGQSWFGDVFKAVVQVVIVAPIKAVVNAVVSFFSPPPAPRPPAPSSGGGRPKTPAAPTRSAGSATSASPTSRSTPAFRTGVEELYLKNPIPRSTFQPGPSSQAPSGFQQAAQATASGCVSSTLITLAVGGSVTLMTAGAAAPPTVAGAIAACAGGAVWGLSYYLVTGKTNDDTNQWMTDVYAGARGGFR